MAQPSRNVDYIIVGQGICGSTLAFRMIEAGLKVLVIDQPKRHSGSRVAAGIVNPVTGRKMVKSWMIDDLLVEVESLYRRMESRLGISCLRSLPIYKLFGSAKEQNDWMLKKEDAEYSPYLSDVFYPDWKGVLTHSGAGIIHKAWWLDMRLLIDTMQTYLADLGSFEASAFDHDMLDHSDPESIRYRDVAARGIVFCEGHQGRGNPYFDHLPLSYAKGEILIIDCPELDVGEGILNRNGFVIPLGSGRFKVGATFQWNDSTPEPTTDGREALIGKFRNICSLKFNIIKIEAAFRPTVKDRRPLLGASMVDSRIYNFNGMGTKGVSLAAWSSRHLLDHIYRKMPLKREVDIRRFDMPDR